MIDNLSRGRLLRRSRAGSCPRSGASSASRRSGCSGRFQETLRIWQQRLRGRALRLRRDALAGARGPPGAGAPPARRLADLGRRQRLPGGDRAARAELRGVVDLRPDSARRDAVWTSEPAPTASARSELGKRPFVVADARRLGRRQLRGGRARVRRALRARSPASTCARASLAAPPRLRLGGRTSRRERLAPHLVMGTPEQCLERLERLHEELRRRLRRALLPAAPRAPRFEATREQILRFGEEVVRPLHARYPAPDHPAIPAACR